MKPLKLITIDGPSASGKSSVSRALAEKLNWPWVSTGAFYRGLAIAALRKDVDIQNPDLMEDLAKNSIWEIKLSLADTLVIYDGEDVTSEISGEEVGAVASKISQIPSVRSALLERQRRCFLPDQGLVAEGRDCGTVVFPQAVSKIFLTASPALRAMRRSEEERQDVEKTKELQKQRDALDSGRKVAPLKVADGALQVDSSFLSLNEVVDEVLKYSKAQGVPLKNGL